MTLACLLALVLGRRAWLHARGEGHPMVTLLLALTAASWNLGIVAFDDDRVFTLTNVVLHGVPYIWKQGSGRHGLTEVNWLIGYPAPELPLPTRPEV